MRLFCLLLFCCPLVGGPREFGLAEFHTALAERGIAVGSLKIKFEVSLDPAQSWHVEPMRISGGDLRGLMYGLMEAATQIRRSGKLHSAKGAPAMSIRGVRIVLTQPVVWDQWRSFLEMLTHARFNRIRIVGGDIYTMQQLSKMAFEYGIEVLPRAGVDPDISLYQVTPPSLEGFMGGDPIGAERVLSGAAAMGFHGFEIALPAASDQYWLTARVWGLAGYNPASVDDELTREFKLRYKERWQQVKNGMLGASRVVSILGQNRIGPDPSPLAVSLALHTSALATETAEGADVEVRRIGQLGRFQARKVLAEEYLRIFRETGNVTALQAAVVNFRGAARISGEQKLGFVPPDLSKAHGMDTSLLPFPGLSYFIPAQHTPLSQIPQGQPLNLSVEVPVGIAVTLHYRDGGDFQTLTGKRSYLVLPASEATYYFELTSSDGTKSYLPDPLGPQPFFRVRVIPKVTTQ